MASMLVKDHHCLDKERLEFVGGDRLDAEFVHAGPDSLITELLTRESCEAADVRDLQSYVWVGLLELIKQSFHLASRLGATHPRHAVVEQNQLVERECFVDGQCL